MRKLPSLFLIAIILLSTYPANAQDYYAEQAPEPLNPTENENSAAFQGADATVLDPTPDAVPQPPPIIPAVPPATSPIVPIPSPFPNRGYVCESRSLTPTESNNILNLLKDGFVGEEISGDALPQQTENEIDDRDELKENNIILKSQQDENVTAKADLPNKKFNPWEISNYLNRHIKGPFAFGLVLDDSLRTGRCKDYDQNCWLTGKNLTYRNSGSGIAADFKPIKEAFGSGYDKIKSWFTDENSTEKPEFTSEEQEVLAAAVFTEEGQEELWKEVSQEQCTDGAKNFYSKVTGECIETPRDEASCTSAGMVWDNSICSFPNHIKTATRLETELLPNSILAQEFDAEFGTNCISNDCIITTYSMFDKYFNQWLSAEMVVTNFGPSLGYAAKKMFGWNARRGLLPGLKGKLTDYADRFRATFETPGSFLGDLKVSRMQSKIDKYGWRDFWQSMTIGSSDGTGYPIIKTQEFFDWWGKQQAKGGFLESIDTLEKKAEFVRVMKDLRTIWRGGLHEVEQSEKVYSNIFNKLRDQGIDPLTHPEGKKALVDYGRSFAKFLTTADDQMGADLPEWIVRHVNMGLYDKGVKQVNTGDVLDLFSEHRNFRVILDKFVDSGNWRNFTAEINKYRSAYETDEFGNLILYGFDPATTTEFRALSYSNLERAAKGYANTWVKTDMGEYIHYTDASIPLIQNRIGGNPTIVQGNWGPSKVLTPEELSSALTNARVGSNVLRSKVNTDLMLNTLRERNWVSRRYWSWLDKLAAEEDEIIRSYFSFKGGAKWTVYPFGYWWSKKGAGFEDLSLYQLPDTWSEVDFLLQDKPLYFEAYIDFFANEGSDQGDLFVQVANKLPWKLVLDEVSDKFNPVADFYNKLSGRELRNETESLAFYLTGPNECVDCFVTLNSANLEDFNPFFVVGRPFDAYILEDTRSEDALQKGQTLIAFAHHMDLKGSTGDIEGERIDLHDAWSNEQEEFEARDRGQEFVQPEGEPKTCKQAVFSLPGYATAKKIAPFLPEEGGIGGVLGGIETLAYATFFWPGAFSTVAIQTLYAPKLQDCVDVEEGYFVHYLVPPMEERDDEGNVELSTEKVSNFIGNLNEQITGAFSGSSEDSLVKEQVEGIGNDIKKFVNDSEEKNIVQARLSIQGQSSGQLKGRKLFYFWCGPGCEMSSGEYKTEGKETVKDKTTGKGLDFDFENGKILFDGKPIVENEDAARLAGDDLELSIPAKKVPRTLTTVCLPPTADVAIQVNARGEAFITHPEARACLQDGVMQQTGLPLVGGNNLTSTFGLVNSVITTTHPNIRPLGDRIVAEGVPRKIAVGNISTINVLANNDVALSSSNDGIPEVGSLKSIQFKNGMIVARPDGCYLIWLRHHEQGILEQNDVRGLDTDLTSSTNPENQCEEPALDFQVEGDPNSPANQAKVAAFNTSLKKFGPFQVFETPTKRYVLSSERDETGACKDHLRVIDKETGEIQDFAGTARATPNGLEFIDENGKKHTLDFAAENGVPTVSFDGQKPEVLTSAQGRNGAFYYDPEKGLWYAENAQLLPLIEAFREGISARVGPNNEVTSTASGNVLNLQVGETDKSLLNLPSLPENPVVLALFIVSLIAVFVYIRREKN
ncbi:MAG: hypothetical protein QT03_C0001G0715 [archaeon GW2011_AR10]|nr:MAG: hypothetical protein QT03_C0001G0715 [archaeon GW2011_AR10]